MKRWIALASLLVSTVSAANDNPYLYDPDVKGYIVDRIVQELPTHVDGNQLSYDQLNELASCEYDTMLADYEGKVPNRKLAQMVEGFTYIHSGQSDIVADLLDPGVYTQIYSHCIYALNIPTEQPKQVDPSKTGRGEAFQAIADQLATSNRFYRAYPAYAHIVATCVVGMSDATTASATPEFEREYWTTLKQYADNGQMTDNERANRMFSDMYGKCAATFNVPIL